MNKYKINREISKLLGFKFTKPNKSKGLNFEQVTYPDKWRKEICSSPVTEVPDFLEIIKRYRKIKDICNHGGIPLSFNFRGE